MPELSITLYSSSFCGACAATRHTLRRASELVGDRVSVTEVNVADAPEQAESLGIATTPTVVMHAGDGREVMRASGAPSLDQVLAAVARGLG